MAKKPAKKTKSRTAAKSKPPSYCCEGPVVFTQPTAPTKALPEPPILNEKSPTLVL